MQAGGLWPRRGRTDGSIRLRVTAFLMFSLALKGASTDVAWIRQESSKIRHLWRLTDSEASSLFSRLAYPCRDCREIGGQAAAANDALPPMTRSRHWPPQPDPQS